MCGGKMITKKDVKSNKWKCKCGKVLHSLDEFDAHIRQCKNSGWTVFT